MRLVTKWDNRGWLTVAFQTISNRKNPGDKAAQRDRERFAKTQQYIWYYQKLLDEYQGMDTIPVVLDGDSIKYVPRADVEAGLECLKDIAKIWGMTADEAEEWDDRYREVAERIRDGSAQEWDKRKAKFMSFDSPIWRELVKGSPEGVLLWSLARARLWKQAEEDYLASEKLCEQYCNTTQMTEMAWGDVAITTSSRTRRIPVYLEKDDWQQEDMGQRVRELMGLKGIDDIWIHKNRIRHSTWGKKHSPRKLSKAARIFLQQIGEVIDRHIIMIKRKGKGWILTLTIPSTDPRVNNLIARYSGYITQRLTQVVRNWEMKWREKGKQYYDDGRPVIVRRKKKCKNGDVKKKWHHRGETGPKVKEIDWFYVWEAQPERGFLHMHWWIGAEEMKDAKYIARKIKDKWYEVGDELCMGAAYDAEETDLFTGDPEMVGIDPMKGLDFFASENAPNGTWRDMPEKWQWDLQAVKKSVAGYFSKYVGKGTSKADREMKAGKEGKTYSYHYPSRWWGSSRSLKKRVKEMLFEYDLEGIQEWEWYELEEKLAPVLELKTATFDREYSVVPPQWEREDGQYVRPIAEGTMRYWRFDRDVRDSVETELRRILGEWYDSKQRDRQRRHAANNAAQAHEAIGIGIRKRQEDADQLHRCDTVRTHFGGEEGEWLPVTSDNAHILAEMNADVEYDQERDCLVYFSRYQGRQSDLLDRLERSAKKPRRKQGDSRLGNKDGENYYGA